MLQIFCDNNRIYDNTALDYVAVTTTPWETPIDLSDYPEDAYYIKSDGKWASAGTSAYRSKTIPIPRDATSLSLTAVAGRNSYYTLLTDQTYSSGTYPSYATGYSNRVSFTGTIEVEIPADANYIWAYTKTTTGGGTDISPSITVSGSTTETKEYPCGAVNPSLSLSGGSAGSLTFSLPPGCYGYDLVQRLTSTIHVFRDGTEIWQGRVLSEDSDIFGNRNITCEGAMAYANDSLIPPDSFYPDGFTLPPDMALGYILDHHNLRVNTNRQLFVGTVDNSITGAVDLNPDYTKTMDMLSNLPEEYGGILRTRIVNGAVYIDWLKDYVDDQNTQTIEFGENLMDFTRNYDDSEYVNAVWVKGHDLETQVAADPLDPNNTDTETVSTPQVVYCEIAASVQAYGRRETFLHYDDILDTGDLTYEGNQFLYEKQYDGMTIDLTAVDLNIIDPGIKPFELLEKVHVVSWPHGMDRYFAVTDLTIPFDNPEAVTFTLSDPTVAYKRKKHRISEQVQDQYNQTQDDLSDTRDYADELNQDTRDYAAELTEELEEETGLAISDAIAGVGQTLNTITKGYIFIDYDVNGNQAIYISSSPVPTNGSVNDLIGQALWKWDANGFGYTTSYQGPGQSTQWLTAINMNGQISANFIATGEMWADRVKLFDNMKVYKGKTSAFGGCIGYGQGHNGVNDTVGIHMFYSETESFVDGSPEVMVSSDGVRMSYGGYSIYVGSGGVVVSGLGQLPCPMTIYGDLTVNGNIYQNV